jgi:hypothetical protein
MNIHERLEMFWSGQKPDKIPYTIYYNEWRHTKHDPKWIPMFEAGLGVTYHVSTVKSECEIVNLKKENYAKNGHKYTRTIAATPIGEIYTLDEDGWTQKYWLETREDYRVMTYIINNIEYQPDYESFLVKEMEIKPYGVALVAAGRTPMQTILVDYVGLENFSYHLFDYEDELMELYNALLKAFTKRIQLIADGPGRFVSVLENFTAETMGPVRYKQYHIPVYGELFPILHEADKVVGTHYDGKLRNCKDLIAKAPIDLIESLTPPPEGDMMLDECRKTWPNKLFWCNINVSSYYLPRKELKELITCFVKQAAPDGKRLAFEVSEQYPNNWMDSIPVVLETLNELD